MLRVNLAQARPGMVLALPLYHPRRPGVMLLREGVPLDEVTILRLREIGHGEAWIRYPGLEHLIQYINPPVVTACRDIAQRVSEAMDSVVSQPHAKLDYASYRWAVSSLLARLSENPKAALFIHSLSSSDPPSLRHATHVCWLSVLMGLKLEFYLQQQRARLPAPAARDVTNLGVGAMLHDIGMLRLDPETIERWHKTGDETDRKWRRHVHIGYELVREDVEPSAAAAVLHHHQKFNGEGFPARQTPDGLAAPKGQEIHVFARIIAAADVFDRLRYPPGGDDTLEPMPVVRALKRILQRPHRDWIDPVVLMALISVVPPYPPGTLVKLNTGRTCVVVDWTPLEPCRPVVQVMGDLDENPHRDRPPRRFDLRQERDMAIVQADGVDVAQDNFEPREPGEFDLISHARKMGSGLLAFTQTLPLKPPPIT